MGERVAERYVIEHRLGSGQHTDTYLARDTERGIDVVLKRPAATFDRTTGAAQVATEIGALGRVCHPGVTALLDHGEDASGPWLAREYVDGPDLGREIEGRPLGLHAFQSLARQSLEALAAVHAAGLAHADIKPANVLLGSGNPFAIKLADFAQAQPLGGRRRPEAVGGTIHTLAPELLEGAPYSERTDLYALGCTLHNALAGRPAFTGETLAEVLAAHALHQRGALPPDVPPPLAAWLDRLVARDPEARFASASAAMAAFSENLL